MYTDCVLWLTCKEVFIDKVKIMLERKVRVSMLVRLKDKEEHC